MRVGAAQKNLQLVTDSAADSLARSRFQDAALTVQKLDGDLEMRKRELTSSLNQYEDAISVKVPVEPRPEPGNVDPFKEPKKPVRPPDPPKRNGSKNGGDAGNVNPFE